MIKLFKNRIKELRKERKITQLQLAKAVFVDQTTISQWETGKTFPTAETQRKLADLFGVSIDYLLGRSDSKYGEGLEIANIVPLSEVVKKKIPILGEIACGEPIFAQEQYGEYIETDINADFALTCKGDSMIGARINDGDLVLIRKQEMVENGAIAAVIIENEATLKRVYYYPQTKKLILQAENPKYEPLVYVDNELENVRILGRAVAFQSLL